MAVRHALARRGPHRRPRVSRGLGEVSGLIRPRPLVASGASIDGSLLYGDLPAPDGAETTDIAEALSELGWRPQHSKSPHSRVGVERADVNTGHVVACAGGTRPTALVECIASTVPLGTNLVVTDEPDRHPERIVGRRNQNLTGFAGVASSGGHRRPASPDPGATSTPVGRMTSILAGPTGPHPHIHERRPVLV